MNINGASHDMIPVGTPTPLTEFRLRDDPGWRITGMTGGTVSTSTPELNDNDGEYFDVYAPDGTRYLFGWGKTPWTTSNETRSVWTTAVFGDDTGEPCHQSTLAASRCQQAWRWNVDMVISDRRNNTIAYTYVDEQNKYAVMGSATVDNKYDRGGFIREITYGALYKGSPTDESTQPTSRVYFEYAFRCVQAIDDPTVACPALSSASGTDYPDTPVDLVCSVSATECATTLRSPTFFTAVRLTGIKTYRRTSSAAAWQVVDWYNPKQAFLNPDNGTETAELWLRCPVPSGFRTQ